jgi:hypothetical protein
MQPRCFLVPCLNNIHLCGCDLRRNQLSELLLAYLPQVLQPSCFHLTKGHGAKLLYANLKQVLQPCFFYYNDSDNKLVLLFVC